MTKAAMLVVSATALLGLTASTARADHKEYVGRTGLVTVREGKQELWMERGLVTLEVKGDKMLVTQEYRLKYPGPPVETGAQKVKLAVREDYFRDKSEGEIDPNQTTTFDSFSMTVDDKEVKDDADSWILNDKKDTATRWHNWWMDFNPGETKTVVVKTVAPIGWDGTNRYIHFVTKDLGGLRKDPDRLEIRFIGPEKAGPVVASLEPKPSTRGKDAARWVYNSSNPKRDIIVKLPSDYRPEGG